MGFAILLAFTAALGLFVRSMLRALAARLERRGEALRALAARRGWEFDPEPGAGLSYRMRGVAGGIRWQLAADQEPGTTDTSPTTKWSTDDIRYDDLVAMIRTTKNFEVLQSIWGRGAMGVLTAMTKMAGVAAPQHSELARTGSRLTFQSPTAARAFVGAVEVERLIDIGLATAEAVRAAVSDAA